MRQLLIRVVLSASVGLVCAAAAMPARSGENHTFIIPPRDGYGISECLSDRGACGRVVADSWCEAHGLSRSSSYGLADDVTAAIPAASGSAAASGKSDAGQKVEPGSYVINCQQ